jgi:hypothetical protein
MGREYIKIKKSAPLPGNISNLRDLSDETWRGIVFYHLISFYKKCNLSEIKDKIEKEKQKSFPRVEREIAKYIRKYLKNNREFDLHFRAIGESTNDEEVEGNLDVLIQNTYWKKEFPFECKNLTSSQDLVNKYVFYRMTPTQNDGGVYRYFNGKYAQRQNFGGMLGFVLSGSLQTIKDRIALKMKTPFDITPEGDLENINFDSLDGINFTFSSEHLRLGRKFTIHHLLFDLQ